jgi:hypothetical protein
MKKNIFELKDFKLKSLALLVTLFLGVGGIKAQDLVVTLTNGNTESFAVANIKSIKFGASDMSLYELNGTTNIWNINDIDNYAFDGVANLEESMNISSNNLNVFPNPSSDNVTINYTSSFCGKITISVTDMNGKHAEDIYFGEHNTETEIYWKAKEKNPSGKYLIKITTENKVITKPVIIQ